MPGGEETIFALGLLLLILHAVYLVHRARARLQEAATTHDVRVAHASLQTTPNALTLRSAIGISAPQPPETLAPYGNSEGSSTPTEVMGVNDNVDVLRGGGSHGLDAPGYPGP